MTYDFRNGAAAGEVLGLGLSEGTARLHQVPDERAHEAWQGLVLPVLRLAYTAAEADFCCWGSAALSRAGQD